MTHLQITPATATSGVYVPVSHTSATIDTSVSVASVTPTNEWTLFLKVWSFTSTTGADRARIQFEDSVDNFMLDILPGPTRCIVPVTGVPEGRMTSWRWRDFDDLRIGTASAKLRTNLTRITGGTIQYEAFLTY